MQKSFIRQIFLILLALIFSGCAKVFISDSEFCSDLGEHGASCAKTLSNEVRDIEKKQWDKERLGMLCTSSDTFSEWKGIILKLCSDTNRCKFEETKKALDNIERVFR